MRENGSLYMGIDVGSVTVKVVLLNEEKKLLHHYYVRSRGTPIKTVIDILDDLFQKVPSKRVTSLCTAGSGGKLFAKILGGDHKNELIAQTKSINEYHPEARTIIEIGGQDSKLMILEREGDETILSDFSLNTQCAAGTGSFLDQQAERLGMPIQEFSELALKSTVPPYIAGRCAVFAKTDIIHLQQVGTPTYDIAAGLCYALARNFRSDIGQGKEFREPIVFQGGLSKNQGMIKAFEDVLGLEKGELIIPERNLLMAAIGAALYARFRGTPISFDWAEKRTKLVDYSHTERTQFTQERLTLNESTTFYQKAPQKASQAVEDAYLGIDVGSISTNLVAINKGGDMIDQVYLRTAGDPLEAVKEGLGKLNQKVRGEMKILGVGTTGSGRELVAQFVGADVIKNEITTQAQAAASIDPQVDTIFEIGGQDSKYIQLENGSVVDFAMNKVCAAGTGAFLEEQAERLNMDIEEFGGTALSCSRPADLGERCTVFMESDLIHHQQRGAQKDELVAGLAYSIASNYLNRVVEDREIGQKIFFQGGVAWNKAVIAAFQKLIGKEIIVPPNHHVTGAYGVALITKKKMNDGQETNFRGFITSRDYDTSYFTCQDCSNHCKIKKVSFKGSRPLFYGSRCGKYDQLKSEARKSRIPNAFQERRRLLWDRDKEGVDTEGSIHYESRGKFRGRVGIPRALLFWDKFPFWSAYFRSLGYQVVLSPRTDQGIVTSSVQGATALACLPSKIVHGHIKKLLDQDLDFLFLPATINHDFEKLKTKVNQNCPLVQGMPYIANGQLDFRNLGVEVIQDAFHFYQERKLKRELFQLGKKFSAGKSAINSAIKKAKRDQKLFEQECIQAGQKILEMVNESRKGMVILSRSYNGNDTGINLDIPGKFREMGVIPIPLDFLDLHQADVSRYGFMHWNYGKRILAAAQLIKKNPHLYGVYLSHFMCGPDSFILHHFNRILSSEPHLHLELDEHSADAGIKTRCEAFLDSLSFPFHPKRWKDIKQEDVRAVLTRG